MSLAPLRPAARAAWVLALHLAGLTAQAGAQVGPAQVQIDPDDIGGIVTGPNGPEAGVWVIAETTGLPTRFARIVVTDDRGRYVIPDLPRANYSVWVRGYGLVDSPKSAAMPGTRLTLTAVPAPNARAAAHYYPAGHWFSLLRVPDAGEFPGTGPDGNGILPTVTHQAQWLWSIKTRGCWACHQVGSIGTREIPAALGTFGSSVEAWGRRIQSGQAGGQMTNGLNQIGLQRALAMFADWTDRIAAGEVPPAPPRPQGLERNVVVTLWDWADPKAYLHDVVSTDRRNPTVNANGLLYGALELSADYVPVLDPNRHTATRIPLSVRDPATQPTSPAMPQPSPYWGHEVLWTSKNNVHNPMLDERGRLWLTSAVRPPDNPPFCKQGSNHPSAQVTPVERAGRHLALYDPATGKLTHISTCFSTHHLMFAEDANRTLWTSGGGPVVGWLNTRMFDETGDEERSQGWTALVRDANGNGRRDPHLEPNQPPDPAKDVRIMAGFYAVAPAPDGSVWATSLGF
ncbi:MAG TPA: carboxypeptidase-like regulatory domain-containing protein, partial [Gemmatimonadales bacterium]|nr:carboxypeptidase-like regulatory domain-containing protein [Gemmatimonadales bacterium]